MAPMCTARQDAIAALGGWAKRLLTVPVLFLLAACAGIIPDGGQQQAGPVVQPSLPTAQVHRIALLAPLSGANGDIGRSLANAATLAYIQTNASNIRLTTYDTAGGAASAASRALAEGNRMILGPLLGDNVDAVAAAARNAGVPVLAFSNDAVNAAPGVYILGYVPRQSVDRVIRYAYAQGMRRFAVVAPTNVYGSRGVQAYEATMAGISGATNVGIERYDRTSNSVTAALRRLQAKGKYDALLIADNGNAATMIAPIARANGAGLATFLGTELWNTDAELSGTPALRGALFASVSDRLFPDFASSYRTQFGTSPLRLSTLGYDAALMTVALSKDWPVGGQFPWNVLTDSQGYMGTDGLIRFRPDGMVDRTLEVQRVDEGTFTIVDKAPATLP